MLLMRLGSRLIRKLSLRSAVATGLDRPCQKYANSQLQFSSSTRFNGYTTIGPFGCNGHNSMECHITRRLIGTQLDTNESPKRTLDAVQFEKVSGETLESLTEYFDELVEKATHLYDADVSYTDGVLTVKFGPEYGTYVINRQSPNKQIWFSSPKSGPKRYDFIDGLWIYKHDGKSLHGLLDDEIPSVVNGRTTFDKCLYGSGQDKV